MTGSLDRKRIRITFFLFPFERSRLREPLEARLFGKKGGDAANRRSAFFYILTISFVTSKEDVALFRMETKPGEVKELA